MAIMVDPGTGGYGTPVPAKGMGESKAGAVDGSDSNPSPSWLATVRHLTGADAASTERLDVAKFALIVLVCVGHFLEPFYKIGNRPTGVFLHAVFGFHVPAFVLISGYVSGDLNSNRRRALVSGIVMPYLVLHLAYSLWYTKAFCPRRAGEVTQLLPKCEFVKNWSLIDPAVGRWDGWDDWTFAYPFAHLWYLVSLLTKRVWRPFALEMRWTILLHLVIGLLVGYTTVGRFLSLHRSAVHMPYFLTGYLMKKHGCFFPFARSDGAKAIARSALVVNIAGAFLATYRWKLKVEVWFQMDRYDTVYGELWKYGALYQLGLYVWTFFTMAIAFALVPEPQDVGVKYPEEGAYETLLPRTVGVDGAEAAAQKKAHVQRRAGRYGREMDQDGASARIYLRLAKWGSRTMYPFCLHIAIVMSLAQFTSWYDVTWTTDGDDIMLTTDGASPAVTAKALFTALMAFVFVIAMSLRPVTAMFKWVLEPDISFLFTPEPQIRMKLGGTPEGGMKLGIRRPGYT